jgi:hypothetical protein
MFGLFRPRCPLNAREKTWLELRMDWLVRQIGFEKFHQIEVVTPTDRYFPERYSGSEQDIERIFRQVCTSMAVPRESIDLQVFDGSHPPPVLVDGRSDALGLYQRPDGAGGTQVVWINRSETTNPMSLVATMAHELAHSILLGQEWLTPQDADHEFVTDLFVVASGLGIFVSNTSVVDESRTYVSGGLITHRWSISKRGYLPIRMFGYALALFAWLRDEEQPRWARELRPDTRLVFEQALRYLRRTDDCLCQSQVIPKGSVTDRRYLAERLTSASAGVRISTFWELRRPGQLDLTDEEWQALASGLNHPDAVVQCEAALAIATMNRADPGIVEPLLRLIARNSDNADTRTALTLALGVQTEPANLLIDELTHLLADESTSVIQAALIALSRFGRGAEPVAGSKILAVFRAGLIACDQRTIGHAAYALRQLYEDPVSTSAEYFRDDGELRRAAICELRAAVDDSMTLNLKLPTMASLPVPSPGWLPPQTTVHQQRCRDEM